MKRFHDDCDEIHQEDRKKICYKQQRFEDQEIHQEDLVDLSLHKLLYFWEVDLEEQEIVEEEIREEPENICYMQQRFYEDDEIHQEDRKKICYEQGRFADDEIHQEDLVDLSLPELSILFREDLEPQEEPREEEPQIYQEYEFQEDRKKICYTQQFEDDEIHQEYRVDLPVSELLNLMEVDLEEQEIVEEEAPEIYENGSQEYGDQQQEEKGFFAFLGDPLQEKGFFSSFLKDMFQELEPVEEQEKYLLDYYTVDKELGKGGFGTVLQCVNKFTGQLVACKTMFKEKYNPQEVNILRYLCPYAGVVGFHDVYKDGILRCLVMDLYPNGDLWYHMKKGIDLPTESQLAIRFRGLIETLCYCHEKGVVHRDIKQSNILISESKSYVLADFGLATLISNGDSLKGLCGTKEYAAPEMIRGRYTEKVDIWSAGIVLCCLLTGERPFKGDTDDELYNSIQKQEIDFNDFRWKNVSTRAIDLVARMLTKDQFERPSAEEVLKHSWFDIDSYSLERKTSSCLYYPCARRGPIMLEQQPCY